jgi:hypothetical protein
MGNAASISLACLAFLESVHGRAFTLGRIDILINTAALELCRSVSKENLQAAYGCDAMQAEMKSGDILILDRTNGAGMTVR